MIKTLKLGILICTLTIMFQKSEAQFVNPEIDGVKKTLNNYLFGGTDGDTVRLISAFHPSATMKYIDYKTGEFKDVPIKEYLDRAKANAGKRSNRQTEIVSVNVEGTAAQAKLKLVTEDAILYDYMNLLKINGEWKIVSKIFSRKNK